jgi:hypothetical protein
MLKKQLFKKIGLAILLCASTSITFGQLQIAPTISQADGRQQFVIVLKGSSDGKDKVFMSNGVASSFDFNPSDLNSYPTWRITQIRVDRGANVAPLYYMTLQNSQTLEYFAFGNKGDNKMISQDEYNKFFERDQNGQSKYSIQDMYHCVYRPYTREDGKHFVLTYHTEKNGASTTHIFMKGWPSSHMRLVLVSLN